MRPCITLVIISMVCVSVSAAACRQTPEAEHAAPVTAQVAETHPEERNAIHLSDDMVRDLRISTAPAVQRPGSGEVMVLGEVVADQTRYAQVTPPIGGQVVRVLAEANSVVQRGAPLVQLRSVDLGRARAELVSADARRDLASQTLERRRSLAAERIVAQREVQEAEAAFRAADADVRAATTALQALGASTDPGTGDEDASLFYVRSPIAGQVLERQAILGQFAAPTQSLFTVADLARVWMIANAFERDAINVRAGSTAHMVLAALPGQEFDGRVTLIGRQVDAGSRTLPIRIEIANPSGLLRPGMSATARLEVAGQRDTILAVPAAALQRVGEMWLVFVPRGPQEFEMRIVGRGRDLGPEVEVVSGLMAGERVVVEGAFLLKAEAEKRQGGADEHGH